MLTFVFSYIYRYYLFSLTAIRNLQKEITNERRLSENFLRKESCLTQNLIRKSAFITERKKT